MFSQQIASLVAVSGLFLLRFCVPFVMIWLFGLALKRIVPTAG